MKAPMSWLRELVELPHGVTTAQVADAFTRTGLQVEHVEAFGDQVRGPVVVGRVMSFVEEAQRNGKTIRWCRVDCGAEHNLSSHNPDITGARGIVCGAANFDAGDYVVVALPPAVLPGDFAISARKTYGHISDGMICAEDELGLGADHEGILVLPPGEAARAGLGSDAMALLGAPDEVLDIDVTPDMGYCLSMRGLAREAAQAFDVPYNDLYSRQVPPPCQDAYRVRVESDDCPLFVNLLIRDVDSTAPTPSWMRHRLAASGMRSINLPVDITNYVMLESGQPLHAYDEDKLLGPIVVRKAAPGETLTTLDGVRRELRAEDLVIADDSGPIGLAGVMGGETTEVTEATTSIVIEAAHFAPGTTGRSYRHHKLPSEASKRFERDVDPGVPCAAARMAARLLAELAGGQIADGATVAGAVPIAPSQVIDANLPARILGARVDASRVAAVLTASGVNVTKRGDRLHLVPPSWRTDLVDPYDYVEEIGRKLGLDVIEPQLPRALPGSGLNREQRARRAVVEAVAQAGFVEVITLPFVGADEIERLGVPQDCELRRLVRLANPLADTQPFLRTSLLPGLFAAASRNSSRSQDDLALFEQGSVFWARQAGAAPMPPVSHRPGAEQIAALDESLPDQPRMLAALVSGQWLAASWRGPAVAADWTHAVLVAQTAAETLGAELVRSAAAIAPWHPGRCARLSVRDAQGELVHIGAAGELHPTVIEAFGLAPRTCAVELDLDLLIDSAPRSGEVVALSPFPLTKEDVALIVDADVAAGEVEQTLVAGGGTLLESVSLFDVYTGPQVGQGKKSLAYNLRMRHPERTLTGAEATQVRDAAVSAVEERFGAVLRQA
ncbi:phenylalanyl-tRNA synthetase beta chain [Propionibacterium cyclohexanicum]|uniref:Phenylalanine--tRNA ligase beta subunit n=1 Tax=Propionibacterium cyclohexanicum TaxID=64702 RepID=A0A1H9PRY6_9ACTN|nr:phenylalanine--tRNA ligase subunit beta [Propionibacterium cyclohexanicum]SER51076.1 phenylalanyl-tRNA synthetase beta chain [Propionibacterium cyclohexanicum]